MLSTIKVFLYIIIENNFIYNLLKTKVFINKELFIICLFFTFLTIIFSFYCYSNYYIKR